MQGSSKAVGAGFGYAPGRRPMSNTIQIRESVGEDSDAIASLYPEAFPDENLLPLVRDLLQDAAAVATSLVAVVNSSIAGHVIFTKCDAVGSGASAALLGPLAVAPAWQRQGVGSALVLAGLARLEDRGFGLVFVLGDPAYYERLGFGPESTVEPPFDLPDEYAGAWQSQSVGERTVRCPGRLSVPRQWLQPALWAP